jgi:hypothetical protein
MRSLLLVLLGAAGACGQTSRRPAVGTDPAAPPPALADPREVHLADLQQLTFGGENAEAYWSFDGSQLIFQTTRAPYGCDQIMRMPADAPATPQLVSTGTGRTTCAYFLPGDDEVVYASTHHLGDACPPPPDHAQGYVWALYDYDVYRAGVDGSNLRRLTERPGYDAEATVCAVDGSIVFTSDRDGDLELYRMNADGSDVRRLTHTPGYDGGAFFNHDCTRLVWRASRPDGKDLEDYQRLLGQGLVRPGKLEIFVGNADGTDARQVTYLDAASFAPYFFPSGDRLLFSTNYGDPNGREFELWAIDVDGTDLERITYRDGFDGFPMFSPDGTRLAFASNRNQGQPGETNVFVARWVDRAPAATAPSIADRFASHVVALADDQLEGRGVGTHGLVAAAAYLEDQLRAAGAEGGMPDGGFRQGFEVTTEVRRGPATALAIGGKPVADDAFAPLSLSATGEVTGKTVDVGYGIVANGIRDDYKGKQVKGKIVVVRRFTPDDGKFTDARLRHVEGSLHRKAITARRAGAIGMIVIDVPAGGKAEEPLPRFDIADRDEGLVVVAVTHAAGAALLAGSHRVRIAVDLDRVRATTDNVVGVIRAGKARDGSAIVLGAHYDHLGLGGAGSLSAEPGIHNGADDNASGVAALIEATRLLAARRATLARDVYVVGFSAEEMGVLGSTWYVQHPPGDQPIAAMLNMDMVGRMRDNLVQVLGGDSAAEWKQLVAPLCTELRLRCTIDGDGRGASDHVPFYVAQVPVLHFFTGGHVDYHRPTDDAGQINAAGGARVAELVAATAAAVAGGAALTYQATATAPVAVGDVRTRGASLGTMPAYADETGRPGVLIQDVIPGGPAHQAGLQGGDRLLSIDGVELRTVHDLMYVLTNSNPGDLASVTYDRAGQEVTVTVTFARPRRR